MAGKDLAYDVRVENEILRRHTEAVINLARRAAEQVSLDDYLQELAAQVAISIEIDHVKVLRYRPERSDLLCEAGIGWREGVVKMTAFPVTMSSAAGRAFLTGQPVQIESLADDDDIVMNRVLVEHAIVSLANVPIMLDGAAWGVLEADSTILRGFSPDTLNFMTACAALAGLVLRRTQAEEANTGAILQTAREAQKRALQLSEMQHRAKNNFQIILAMITLQMKDLSSEQNRAAVQRLSDNILAMSLANDQLSAASNGGTANLRTYLEALVTSLAKPVENVTVEVAAEDMAVSIDQATPLGLIVNEAMTNAFKHAFDPGKSGAIRVGLRPAGAGQALLSISDNGKGFKDAAPGTGMKLIDSLAKQLRGSCDRTSSADGTTLNITFPRAARTLRNERASIERA